MFRQLESINSEEFKGFDSDITETPQFYGCLENLGNTCYINSALQCLASLDSLVIELIRNTPDEGKSLVCELKCLLVNMRSGAIVIHPLNFHTQLKATFEIFNNKRQQDAHEFMRLLLDHVHEETKIGQVSVVSKHFEGKFTKRLKCPQGHTWTREETFYEISVPIPEKNLRVDLEQRSDAQYDEEECKVVNEIKGGFFKSLKGLFSRKYSCVVSLPDCLSIYTDPTEIEIECEQCCSHVPVKIKMAMTVAPKILMICIKRFAHTWRSSKVNSFVMLPKSLTFLDFDYKLKSFLSHKGSISRGHYKAYVKSEKGEWICLNDQNIKVMKATDVLKKRAYLAFYELL